MTLIYIFLAILAGISFAVQGPTNTALGTRTGKLRASLISFAGGFLLLSLVVLLVGNGNLGKIREAEVWQLFGGLYGAWGVLTTILVMPELGLALTLTVIMLGQLLMGAVIDMNGLFLSAKVAVTPLRVTGIAVVIIGILLIYSARKENGRKQVSGKSLLMILMALSSGALGAIQSPTNASLSELIGKIEGAWVSFAVGLLAMVILNLADLSGRKKQETQRSGKIRFWMLLGGFYGGLGVYLNILATPVLGVALLVVSGMFGQLAGGLAVDTFGWMESRKIPLNFRRTAGIGLIAVGMILVSAAKIAL